MITTIRHCRICLRQVDRSIWITDAILVVHNLNLLNHRHLLILCLVIAFSNRCCLTTVLFGLIHVLGFWCDRWLLIAEVLVLCKECQREAMTFDQLGIAMDQLPAFKKYCIASSQLESTAQLVEYQVPAYLVVINYH